MAVGIMVFCLGVLSRRRTVVLVLGGLSVAVLSFNAREGLQPVQAREWAGVLRLVSDPKSFPGRVVVDAETDLGRVQLTATGRAASAVRQATAGRVLSVQGTLRNLAHPERVAYRHVRMALSASEASLESGTDLWRIPVVFVRGTILRGAQVLPEDQRPIYTGFVIGDDRGTRQEVVQAFKDSGLTHLLVVSGQNVVFLLAIATPLAARLGRRTNVIVLLSVLLLFAAVTRFEPSVLRATAMAMLAVAGSASGRPLSTCRRIAVAVALLIMIDPLLVESLGFRLSVAATVGIALFASGIARRLKGPEWFKRVLSITVASQVGVAPLIIPVVGPMPLASLPANVLAEPIAGFVMMWGSTVGVVAGLIGGWPAAILQAPVRLGVWWIMNVAESCSDLPLPRVSLPVIILVTLCMLALLGAHSSWRRSRRTQLRPVSAG